MARWKKGRHQRFKIREKGAGAAYSQKNAKKSKGGKKRKKHRGKLKIGRSGGRGTFEKKRNP